MRYFTFDAQGKITGSYVQELRPEHAAAHIACTEEQQRNRFHYIVQSGQLVNAPVGTYAPPPLTADQQRQADIEASTASDTTLADLRAMTNAQLTAWADANITNLGRLGACSFA